MLVSRNDKVWERGDTARHLLKLDTRSVLVHGCTTPGKRPQ